MTFRLFSIVVLFTQWTFETRVLPAWTLRFRSVLEMGYIDLLQCYATLALACRLRFSAMIGVQHPNPRHALTIRRAQELDWPFQVLSTTHLWRVAAHASSQFACV